MLAWFPVVILCSVVDRTPWATDEIRVRLNNLLDDVRTALLDTELRETYMRKERRTQRDFQWIESLRSHSFLGSSGFFTGFAGQGRLKFHYGIANPILTGIEEAYVAHKGRGWLGTTPDETWQARTSLVLGPQQGTGLEGLKYWDPRGIWEILCAITVVGGPVIGAFVISYYTPTVGFGCRSGGYTIFFMIAFGEAFFEGVVWWFIPEGVPSSKRADLGPESKSSFFRFFQKCRANWKYDPRWIFEIVLLRPLEIANTAWLIYIIVAQTFGVYNNCFCQASTWAGGGGCVLYILTNHIPQNADSLQIHLIRKRRILQGARRNCLLDRRHLPIRLRHGKRYSLHHRRMAYPIPHQYHKLRRCIAWPAPNPNIQEIHPMDPHARRPMPQRRPNTLGSRPWKQERQPRPQELGVVLARHGEICHAFRRRCNV